MIFGMTNRLSPVDTNPGKNLKIIKLEVKIKLIGMIADRQYLNLHLSVNYVKEGVFLRFGKMASKKVFFQRSEKNY